METCFANTQTYVSCDAATVNQESTGVDIVDGAPADGKVGIITASSTATGYKLTGASKSGNDFSITKNSGTGVLGRTCTTVNNGGCPAGGLW